MEVVGRRGRLRLKQIDPFSLSLSLPPLSPLLAGRAESKVAHMVEFFSPKKLKRVIQDIAKPPMANQAIPCATFAFSQNTPISSPLGRVLSEGGNWRSHSLIMTRKIDGNFL